MRFQLAPGDDVRETLWKHIDNALTRRKFGSHSFEYLRAAEIRDLASDHTIAFMVNNDPYVAPGVKKSLISQIQGTARGAFLISVHASIGMEELYLMLKKGLKDQILPFTEESFREHRNSSEFRRFRLHQYIIPPVLTDSAFLAYEDHHSVPIEGEAEPIPTKERLVYPGYIDINYHEIVSLESHSKKPGLSKSLAIMEVTSSKQADQSRARSELEFARFLATYASHEHIIRPYGTFTVEDLFEKQTTRYIIAEYPHGYLSAYFDSMDPPTADDWIRKQIRGLAAALALMHKSTGGKHGVHNDIRPRMIAVCSTSTGDLVFKFALSDQSRILPPPDGPGLPGNPPTISPYHPPDSYEGRSLSREQDVWALGCVFLELMVWYTQGRQAYAAFREAACGTPDNPRRWFRMEEAEHRTLFSLVPAVSQQLTELMRGEQFKWARVCGILRTIFRDDNTLRPSASDLVASLNDPTMPI